MVVGIVDICTEVTRIDRLEIIQYLSNLIRLDAIILNEDRHLNNVSFIKSINGDYSLCPVFDNGGSFFI